MNESDLKTLAREYFEKAWMIGRDLERYVAADVVRYMHGKVIADGLEELIRLNRGYHEAFSDWKVDLHDMVAEGNRIAIRFELELTHVGVFHGFEGTGKRITVRGIDLFHYVDGVIHRQWAEADIFDVERQIQA